MSHDDARGRFLRSSGAAIFSQAWRVLVAFGVQLVLKRLVPASDWVILPPYDGPTSTS